MENEINRPRINAEIAKIRRLPNFSERTQALIATESRRVPNYCNFIYGRIQPRQRAMTEAIEEQISYTQDEPTGERIDPGKLRDIYALTCRGLEIAYIQDHYRAPNHCTLPEVRRESINAVYYAAQTSDETAEGWIAAVASEQKLLTNYIAAHVYAWGRNHTEIEFMHMTYALTLDILATDAQFRDFEQQFQGPPPEIEQ